MNAVFRSALAVAMAACAVSACGGSGPSNAGVPSGLCATVAPPKLLYPAPGQTAIPDSGLDVYFGYPVDPSTAWSVPSLTPAGGGQTLTGEPYTLPSPGPTNPPGLLPLPAGDTYYVSHFTTLATSTTYGVSVTNTLCNQSFSLGSFTTM